MWNGKDPWIGLAIWLPMTLYFGRGIYVNFKNKEYAYAAGSLWICCFGIYFILVLFGIVPSFLD